MSIDSEWETLFLNEIQKANQARNSGNEGKARVCARRATGIIIKEYLHRNQLPDPGTSMYERLVFFNSLPFIDETIKETIAHFIIRVTPNHKLPIEVDLINDAIYLKENLLNSFSN